ncbi:MAG: pilus assembly protein [Anaerolineae bacterium]|nr:pilus assembly protein [Anaerolineae bacterium]
MDTPKNMTTQPNTRKRKGQTLAEFAITLPILLILVFGVFEFGRIFQAWVTLQNSARTAARYASTGSFDELRFPINDTGVDDPDSVVPCVVGDERGTLTTFDPNGDGKVVDMYEGGSESLFATWWDGRDCDPRLVQHQNMRKDIVRILSIFSEARRGAAGLSIPNVNPIDSIVDEAGVRDFLFAVWTRPLPGSGEHFHLEGSDEPSWFDVMLCSSRPMLDEVSERKFSFGSRYAIVLDPNDGAPELNDDRRAPVCLMNEVPPAGSGSLDNANVGDPYTSIPWWDAGDAGDSVTVVVTFNHPLITPLGLAEYLPLQARRVAVNESFRVADSTRAIVPPGSTGGINKPPVADAGPPQTLIDADENGFENVTLDGTDSFDPDGTIVSYTWRNASGQVVATGANPTIQLTVGTWVLELTVVDDDGAEATDTVTIVVESPAPTSTPRPTDTRVPSRTPIPPFDCDLLSAGQVSFSGNRVSIQFTNANIDSTTLTRANLNWRTIGSYPTMYVSSFSLDGIAHWLGQDYTPPTDTNADPSNPPDVFLNADRTMPGDSVVTWEAVFAGGPPVLNNPYANPPIEYMTQYDLGGTYFEFLNPEDGSICHIELDLPEPTPSPTIDPARPSNTPTFTPDCASDQISVRFIEFQSFGVVRLEVTNLRPVVGILLDFQVNWIQRSPGIMTLERVTVGGNGPADVITPTVRVWQSGSASEDANPPTSGKGEGTWLSDFTFPPNSVTPLYLDFGGTTTTIQSSFNVQKSDFNGTWFEISCGTDGGNNGGGGGGNSGRIDLTEEDTPQPTDTRGPTNTPRPTYTPSKTWTPGPPTNTPRPQPTSPPQPTNTQKPPTPFVLPSPTRSGGSGGE